MGGRYKTFLIPRQVKIPCTPFSQLRIGSRMIWMTMCSTWCKMMFYSYIWVTTLNNLLAFRMNSQGLLEQVDTSSFLPQENKMLSEVIKDQDKNLWVAAYDQKSFIINLQDSYISEYKIPALQRRINGNPAIVSLCKDDDNIFWLSQDRYGICLYSPDRDIIVHYNDCKGTQNHPYKSYLTS